MSTRRTTASKAHSRHNYLNTNKSNTHTKIKGQLVQLWFGAMSLSSKLLALTNNSVKHTTKNAGVNKNALKASIRLMNIKSLVHQDHRKLSLSLATIVLTLVPATSALAAGTQTFTKELIGSTTRKVGEVVTYELKSACNSLTSDCGSLTITDNLPSGMVIDSCAVPPGFTINSCVPGTSNIEITKDTAFDGGTSYVITVKGLIEFDADPNVPLANTANSVITSPLQPENDSIDADAAPINVSTPVPNWSLEKKRTSPTPPLKATWDTDVSYTVSICSNTAIGNVSLTGVQLSDSFPANAEIINDGGANASTNPLVWDVADAELQLENLYSGQSLSSKQCIDKNYTLKYPDAHFDEDDAIDNTISATNTSAATINPVTLNDVIGIPTPGASLGKSGNDVLPNEDLIWYLIANVNASNAPVPELKIYETIPQSPAGLTAKSITSGTWNSPATTNEPGGSDVRATIDYSTTDVSASSCDAATTDYATNLANEIPSPASSVTYSLPANATCVRWTYVDKGADGPAVPRGWSVLTDAQLVQGNAYPGPFPTEVANTVTATFKEFDGSTGSSSTTATLNIEEATPEIIVAKTSSVTSLAPLDTTTFTLRFRHDTADSTGATINPVITDLLPAAFEFVSWDSVTGLGSEDEPNLEVIEDFNGTGRTLVRYSWADNAPANSVKLDGSTGVNNPASFAEGADVYINFTARVKPGTAAATYTNEMQFFDNSPRFTCNTGTQADVNDMDSDGDTAENLCNVQRTVVVISASVIDGAKWVKGDLENIDDPVTSPAIANADCPDDGNGFTRFPCVAQTTHGGDFDYAIKVQNAGNEPLKDYIFYDVLPALGDTGVGEPLSASQRGTAWRPELLGAIVPSNQVAIDAMAQTDSIIEYSSSDNACRDEVSATTDETGWQSGCVDDWTDSPADFSTVTAFRIRATFGDTAWQPLDQMEFSVQMKAPTDAPPSILDDAANFNPAWNSFAHRVSQDSNGTRLPTAEPRQVGIVLPPKYRLGNLVWIDTDRDGIADDNENGVPSVAVKLFAAGDDPATATAIAETTTDSEGHYFFDHLDAGDYFVFIPKITAGTSLQTPLSGLISSSTGEEADPNDDGDNNDNGTNSSIAGLASGTITLGASSEPVNEKLRAGSSTDDDADGYPDPLSNYSIDFGFVPVVSIGSVVWDDANNNGLQDNGELGLEGATVTLLDSNENTVTTDINGDPIAPQVTLQDGRYFFSNLPADDYKISVTPPAGYLKSDTQNPNDNDDTANDSNIASSSNNVHISGLFTLSNDGEPDVAAETGGLPDSDDADDSIDEDNGNMTVDFAFYKPVVSIGSLVWNDKNNNGLQDNGEQGIENAIVTLLDENNQPVTADDDNNPITPQVTGADGLYFFGNLTQNNYKVQVTPPAGFVKSTTQNGADNSDIANDSNIANTVNNNHISGLFTLAANSEPTEVGGLTDSDNADSMNETNGNMTVDFGFYEPVAIGNVLFLDNGDGAGTANNGIQDGTEPPVPENVKVELYTSADVLVTDTVTDANGRYYFDNLVEGSYYVKVPASEFGSGKALEGYYSSTGADSTESSDATENGIDDPNPATNGIQSNIFTLEAGTETTGEDQTDYPGTLADASVNATDDFGFYQPVAIGNVLFFDNGDGAGTVNNGIQDGTEPSVPAGVNVELYTTADVLVASTTTDTNGRYYFDNLVKGDYYVKVPASEFASGKALEGYSSSTDADATETDDSKENGIDANPLTDGIKSNTFTLTPGAETTREDQTDYPGTLADGSVNATNDFGFVKKVAIGNTLFFDNGEGGGTANNGIQDGTENGVPAGVKVELYSGGGVLVAETTTDADGHYFFDNLVEDDYFVKVPSSEFGSGKALEGYFSSTGSDNTELSDDAENGIDDSDPAANGIQSNTFTLEAGTEVTGEDQLGYAGHLADASVNATDDFGFYKPVAIGNVLFFDNGDGAGLANNGIQEANEPSVPAGVNVELYTGADIFVASTTTDANGRYYFDNLAEGEYYVKVPASEFSSGKALEGYYSSTGADTTESSDTAENGIDDANPATNGIQSNTFTLEAGAEMTGEDQTDYPGTLADASVNATDDFGFYQPVAIGNVLFFDNGDGAGTANNGVQDGTEPTVPAGVNIELYTAADVLVSTTTTDVNGRYYFDNLAEGDYYVKVPASEFAAGKALENYFSSTGADSTETSDEAENGIDDSAPQTNGIQSNIFTLEAGSEATGEDQLGYSGTLADASVNATDDFGFIPAGSWSGNVSKDTDNDDVGDANLGGVVITLYKSDSNGQPDGDAVATTSTDSDGNYSFTHLPAGDYVAVQTQPAGLNSVSENEGGADDDMPDNGTENAIAGTVDAGETDINNDFVEEGPGSWSGHVGKDTNNDDSSDEHLEGVEIKLYQDTDGDGQPDGNALHTTTTNSDGNYSFINLSPGDYVAVETQPAGLLDVVENEGGGDDDKPDNGTINSIAGTIDASESDTNNDFVEEEPGNWSGNVSKDTDNDDEGEVKLIGVEIELYADTNNDGQPDGAAIATTTTDTDGNYSFTNLAPGDYVAVEIQPDGLLNVIENDGGVDNDKPDNLTLNSIAGTVDAGETDSGNDFVEEEPGSWSGHVGKDTDNDDMSNENLANVSIELFTDPNGDGDPADGTSVGTTTTDTDGNYSFSELPAGQYVAVETQPDGLLDVSENEGGQDNDQPNNSLINSIAGIVEAGENDSQNNFVEEEPVSIGSTVFFDNNNDGTQGAGEEGIFGLKVTLYESDGTSKIKDMATDAQGNYFFDNLAPGQYVVGVEAPYEAPTSSTDISTSTADNQTDGDDNGLQTNSGDEAKSPVITLLPQTEPLDIKETAQGGQQETGADSSGDMTVDFGFAPPVSIGSTVFFDSNNNGVQDETEIGIADTTVTLYQEDGTTQVALVQTNGNGDYFFGNLLPGKYIVSVEAPSSAPTSSTDIATSNADNQTDSDDNGIQANSGEDAKSPVITLIAGSEPLDAVETGKGHSQDTGTDNSGDMTVDFGFVPLGASIQLIKTVYGNDDPAIGQDGGLGCTDGRASSQAILVDINNDKKMPVTYCFELTNTGETNLTDIAITDTTLGLNQADLTVLNGPAPAILAPGETIRYYYGGKVLTESLDNTATVTAKPVDSNGNPTGADSLTTEDTSTAKAVFIIDPPSALKTVTPSGEIAMQWEMVWINPSNVSAPGVVVYDEVPEGTHFVALPAGDNVSADGVYCETRGASTTDASFNDHCYFEQPNSNYPRGRVIWSGTVASDPGETTEAGADNEVVIRFTTALDNPDLVAQEIDNQATSEWDYDNDGTPEFEAPTKTPAGDNNTTFKPDEVNPGNHPDNPGNPGNPGNNTPVDPANIPTLSEWALLLLSMILMLTGKFENLITGNWASSKKDPQKGKGGKI